MLWLALLADPLLAISGLVALVRGKRVRGWNRLCLAASGHRHAYRAWIDLTESSSPDGSIASLPAASIGIIVLEGRENLSATQATLDSLRTAFGSAIRLLPDDTSPAGLPVDAPRWLLPIRAGDRVAARAGNAVASHVEHGAGVVYWDEDRAGKTRHDPWLKPGWDPLLFARADALVGSALISRTALHPSASTWWDAALNAGCNERATHVHQVLTHRAGRPLIRTLPARPLPAVSTSIIIPTRDRADLLARCIEGVRASRTPGTCEIIVIDNGSVESATADLLRRIQATDGVRVLGRPGPFNYAELMNDGVSVACGELVCLLNNDVEPCAPRWLEAMARHALADDVGAVGARLLYPDGRVQHAGVALGIGEAAGHVEKGAPNEVRDFAPWHTIDRTVSAVTAACLVVLREKFQAVGGMDAERFTVDFNDVDLCLRLAQRGWKAVYCADAVLVHGESKSRGTTRSGEQAVRFDRELAALRERWNTRTCVDPWHHPAFRRQSERCILAL